MTKSAYMLLGLTAIVAALAAVLAFAILRAFAAARNMAKGSRNNSGAETAFMAAAMEEALARLKLREQALAARAEASERLSDEIIASLTSGLLVVDADHCVKSLNPAGRRLLGMPEADWHADVSDVLVGAGAPLAQVIEECLSSGQPIRRRQVQIQAGDRATHLGVSVSPIGDGAVHGAICLFSDLTDIVDLEEQLRLKDSLAQVGELTAGIAHEFRNGLATIHGYARLLDLDRLPPDSRPYLTGIRDETELLGAVVRNFLNFAKPAELVMGAVDVKAVVERAADEIRADVAAHGGTVSVHGEFVSVPGDEVLLKQALSNLCRNAVEACTGDDRPPCIVLEGAVDTSQSALRVAVIDNGPGVDPAVAAKIFRPFVTTRARGTGMGLALVQKIVVTHNGRVALQAEPGGGTRFTLTLPLAEDSGVRS